MRFGQLVEFISDKLSAAQKATLARLGPFVFNDSTREDSLTHNWCAFTKSYGAIYTGECKLNTTNVREGRGAYYYGDLNEGYFKNDIADGSARVIYDDGTYTVG